MTSLTNLNNGGIANDGGTITTSGAGIITAANGILRNVSILASPFQLTTNPTVTSGTTTTLTCTGGGTGVPTGAIAVLLNVQLYSITAGGTCQIGPHGSTPGNYINLTPQWSTNNTYTGMGMVIAPLSTGGQIDVKAANQSMVLQSWYIFGYII